MSDYPLSLAGSHGRIAAYRAALELAENALAGAVPYVYNVANNPAVDPWRHETATQVLGAIETALAQTRAELAVTS